MEVLTPERKPSQVIAWLGFGLSLAVLVLIWVVNLLSKFDKPFRAYYNSQHD